MKELGKSIKQIKWLAMQNRSKNLFRFVCSGSVSYFRFGVWWRSRRVELSLKQQLVVWVIPNWDVGGSLAMAGSVSHIQGRNTPHVVPLQFLGKVGGGVMGDDVTQLHLWRGMWL